MVMLIVFIVGLIYIFDIFCYIMWYNIVCVSVWQVVQSVVNNITYDNNLILFYSWFDY